MLRQHERTSVTEPGHSRVVLLITVDSLRADELSRPDAAAVAPTLTALRDAGTTFTDAHAHGNWTPFSFPSILGTDHVFRDGPDIGIGGPPTLATHLGEAGVATGGFNAANGFLSSHWGYDRGFDRFRTCLEGGRVVSSRYLTAHPTVQAWLQFLAAPARGALARMRGRDRHPGERASKLQCVETAARSFLRTADTPLFCWLHYMDLHTPYVPAPKHVRSVTDDATGYVRLLRSHVNAGLGRAVTEDALESLRTLYRAALAQVDASVRRVLDTLAAEGLRDETTVILTGDHGEEFLDHGHLAHYPKVYDELTHVPLVVDSPRHDARTVDDVVGLDSIPPTVSELLDVDPGAEFVGDSLVPTVAGRESPAQEPVLSLAVRGAEVTEQPIPRSLDAGDPVVSARTDRFTYIYDAGRDAAELYDRQTDPGEGDECLESFAADPRVGRLRSAVDRYLARLGGGGHAADAEGVGPEDHPSSTDGDPDATVERRLAALGYR